ncbi:MAG TPA: Crp/Fnr family transcriptional regulator [Verrucomicrobiae bacterium]|nr:Crp/Fnr family transcriptional regulator [Verrucomicrobiae bacterium]
MSPTTPNVTNLLLDGLPRRERERLLAEMERVDLQFGQILCEPESAYAQVYFPLTASISMVALIDNREPLEIDLVGNEGMLGATLALGVSTVPLRGMVRGNGTALRMTASAFRAELRQCPELSRTVQRYLYVLISQLAQAAGCMRFHEVDARLARWLLTTHDCAHGDHFHLTHKMLGGMLGVRRSGVTIAAGILQRRNLIRYTRGAIRVLDRRGLEAAACECYDAGVRDYAQTLR